jgi:hypothetical protein
MKIYAVADIHGARERERRAIELASESDLAIVCGDITQFGPPEDAKRFLDKMGDVVKTLALPGNCDEPGTIEAIEASAAKNIHNNRIEFQGFPFFGYSGSSPFGEEEETYDSLKRLAKEKGVLCTHAAPKGHLDLTLGGYSIGSGAVLRVIEETKPVLSLFGHVHEGVGSEIYKGSWLVNCSSGWRGNGCYVDLGPGVEGITFLD